MRIDAIRRDYVLAEIFVLIVAPDHDEIGPELIDLRARLAQRLEEAFAMMARRGDAFVTAPLLAHRLRPSVTGSVLLGQVRILEHAFENPRHGFVAAGQWRVMRY